MKFPLHDLPNIIQLLRTEQGFASMLAKPCA
jgi:hypothetical protein